MVKFVEALPKVNWDYTSIFIWKRSFDFHPMSNVRSFTSMTAICRNIIVILFTLKGTVRMQDGLRLNKVVVSRKGLSCPCPYISSKNFSGVIMPFRTRTFFSPF